MSKFSSFKSHQLITENWKKFLKEGSAEADLVEGAANSAALLKLVELLSQAGLDMNTIPQQIAAGAKAYEQIFNMIRGPRTRSAQEEWPVDIAMQDALWDAWSATGMEYEDLQDTIAELAPATEED